MITVEGVYRDGRVELPDRPLGIDEPARVLVTFLPPGLSDERGELARTREQARLAATERLLGRLSKGIPFGGPPYPKREELYDRFDSGDESPR
jgi:hypothetical protein